MPLPAKAKPLSELERCKKIIQEFGMQSFKDWRNSYKAVYKKAATRFCKKTR